MAPSPDTYERVRRLVCTTGHLWSSKEVAQTLNMSQSHASHTLRKLAAEGEITGFQLGGGFVYMESLPHGPNVKSVLSHLIRIGMAANIWIHRPDHNKLTSLLTHLNKLAANLDIALNESHSDE